MEMVGPASRPANKDLGMFLNGQSFVRCHCKHVFLFDLRTAAMERRPTVHLSVYDILSLNLF